MKKNTVKFNMTPDHIELDLSLKLSNQEFLHLEKAISNYYEAEVDSLKPQSKESIEKYGSSAEYLEFLFGYMKPLSKELRKQYNEIWNPVKKI